MQKIIPNIWCQGTADQAADFYLNAFSDFPGGVEVLSTVTYPETGLFDFQEPFAGKTLTVDLAIAGFRIILINAGEEFTPNASISLMMNFDAVRDPHARKHLDVVWERLLDGGTALMPVDKYPFSEYYGWVQDKYGVSWQLMLSSSESEPGPSVIPMLLFGGAAQNKAAEAQEYYVDVFPHSRLGDRAVYGQPTGPATAEALMFSQFQLDGQWIFAMDSGVDQDFSFNEGVSLMYESHGQEELDAMWDALSADPTAEACGWLKDKFGVSWQIVPDNMEELMASPGAFEKLLSMKKIEIEKF
ncbi:3-demethylubiquinone-9 3-methyltransferase [Corynebacterium suranareeae]|uniref:3-demethylubiquinone-9 3-methyltransferase n=1 Tax=Corynebacterium suranareeae TaxID=2506452 RepID=A0A160PT02_9CORY|nr:VOC family protein [Corynebacterium suranareeae]BAU96333.1 3-demethylubiquinone-9 3-methyltransferase [Corynebacterium suranareeae]